VILCFIMSASEQTGPSSPPQANNDIRADKHDTNPGLVASHWSFVISHWSFARLTAFCLLISDHGRPHN
jgi:hypothetical protein